MAAKIIAARFNAQTILIKSKKYGDQRGNYLLFDGLDKNRVSNKIRRAYEMLGVVAKSPHDCRHTFCTELVALTEGHHFLAKYVLGHSDIATTENYLHLWEVIQQKMTQDRQIEDSIDLDDIIEDQ
jgi:integrase